MSRLARRVAAGLCLALACLGAPGHVAAETPREQALAQLASRDPVERRAAAERLGRSGRMADAQALLGLLFDTDEPTRDAAEAALWQVWSRSGDKRVDALYRRGLTQMNAGGAAAAVATFGEIIRLKPDFAEGWNKRATVLFFLGRYQESLADCAEVLRRNPAHFGALSGMGQIYSRLEDYDRALEHFEKALAINPNLEGVALNVVALRRLREEKARRSI